MEQTPSYEELKEKLAHLERKIKEFDQRRGEQYLQDVSRQLEKIAGMGDDGIIVFDQDYQIEFANTVASELTGYSRGRLLGMDFRRLLSERDIGYLDQMHSEVGEDESKRVCTEMEVLTEKGLKPDAEVCITIAKVEQSGINRYSLPRSA